MDRLMRTLEQRLGSILPERAAEDAANDAADDAAGVASKTASSSRIPTALVGHPLPPALWDADEPSNPPNDVDPNAQLLTEMRLSHQV